MSFPKGDDIVYYFRVTPTEFICGFCEKGGVPQETSYAINMNTITNAGGWHVGWQEAGGEAIIGTEYESFGIFSEDISIAQIQSLANGDAATSIGAVVQKYYSMDEGSGTVVNLDGDIGNAATQGTIQGSLAWSTDVVGVDPSTTTDPIKNNTGQLLADETGVIADVYDTTNGALVVRKTGLTSDVSGVVTFSDALMSAATEYRVVITLTGNAEGLARITTV